MTDKRKGYKENFDAQLKESTPPIALLNAEGDKTKAEVKIEYYKAIQALRKESRTQPE